MNYHRLNIARGTKLTDGTHTYRFWGKIQNSYNRMVYCLFDEHDIYHEFSSNSFLRLKAV